MTVQKRGNESSHCLMLKGRELEDTTSFVLGSKMFSLSRPLLSFPSRAFKAEKRKQKFRLECRGIMGFFYYLFPLL